MSAREEAREIQRLKRNMDGAPIRTQAATREYREGWERVFGKRDDLEEYVASEMAAFDRLERADEECWRKFWADTAARQKSGRALVEIARHVERVEECVERVRDNQRRRTARNGGKQP